MNRLVTALARAIRTLLVPAVALLAVLTLLGACTIPSSRPSPTATYTPVPDAELYRRIAALPHVTNVIIDYSDSFSNGSRYDGGLTTDGQENPYLTLDQTIAILRQGVLRAYISIDLDFPGPDGRTETAFSSRFPGDTESDLSQRYGPQPGSGIPPASPPVPTPSNWTPPTRPANSPGASA